MRLRSPGVAADEQGATQHAVNVRASSAVCGGALQDPSIDRDRLGRLASRQQRFGEPRQQLWRRAITGQGDGGLQALARGGNRSICHRGPPRSLQHGDCLRIAEQLPAHRMLGCFRGLGAVCEQVAEGGCVPSLSDRWGHVLVQRLLKERVGKLRPARLPGPDEAGVDENPQGLCRFAVVEAGHTGREQRPELDAEHARCMCVAKVGARARDP